MLEPRLRLAINTMAVSIARILGEQSPSIYLYGSITAEDYRHGWSDIDLLVLTADPIPADKADLLVNLRQVLSARDPDTPYYRLFEGGMLDLGSFLTGEETRVVYWGTTGQRLQATHGFSAFDRASLLQSGQLLWGKDVRRHLDMPDEQELHAAVAAHLRTLKEHGRGERSLYAFGWLLDAARCICTLVTHQLVSKTDAAQWLLDRHVSPCPEELSMALTVRRSPGIIADPAVLDYAEGLTPAIAQMTALLDFVLHEAPSLQ